MAWIESHQSVANHPKTRKLARRLDVSIPTAMGHLHCLWHWALEYAEEGNLEKHDAEDVAIGAMWEGEPKDLLDALVSVRFLDETPRGLELHNWDRYTGRLIEKRKQDAERKRKSRERRQDPPPPSEEPPEDIPETSGGHPRDGAGTEPNPTEPDLTEPNQEPSRASFDAFWDSYPQRRGTKGSRKNALTLWKKLPESKREAAIVSLPAYSRVMGEFPKDAERYLRHEAWEGLTTTNGHIPSTEYEFEEAP